MTSMRALPMMLPHGLISKDSPLPMRVNKKVISLMKGVRTITEFVVLRLKFYACDGNSGKRCKGFKKCIIRKSLTFEEYEHCLFVG